jgi:hypothetical protein
MEIGCPPVQVKQNLPGAVFGLVCERQLQFDKPLGLTVRALAVADSDADLPQRDGAVALRSELPFIPRRVLAPVESREFPPTGKANARLASH